MINEILSFRRSMESWNIEIPQAPHLFLKQNTKDVKKAHIVFLDVDGNIKGKHPFEESINLYRLAVSNSASAFTFKFSNAPNLNDKKLENVQRACKRHFALHREWLDKINPDSDCYDLFTDLVQRIEKIEVDNFVKEMLEYCASQEIKKEIYISLDLHEKDPGLIIQTQSFFSSLSECLHELDYSDDPEKIDDFGNSYVDASQPISKIKLCVGEVPLFSRNKDNRCFADYGLNSVDAVCIGGATRSKLNDVMQYMLSESRRYSSGKEGTWYSYAVGDKNRGTRDYIVVSSLYPYDPILEYGVFVKEGEEQESDVGEKEWEDRLKKVISVLRSQNQSLDHSDAFGQITVFRILTGAWHVAGSEKKPFSEIADCIQNWIDGVSSFCSLYPILKKNKETKKFHMEYSETKRPSIRQFVDFMNKVATNSEFKRERGKSFEIFDGYKFFFGDENTVESFAKVYADNLIYPMLDLVYSFKGSYYLNFLIPMQNIILHKLGYRKEEIMENEWAYNFGVAMREINKIYRLFFVLRNQNVPRALIGQTYLKQAFSNPHDAYGQFIRHSQACLQWAENYNLQHKAEEEHDPISLYWFNKAVTKVAELTKGNLPHVPTAKERHLMFYGYREVFKKRELSEVISDEEALEASN